MNYNEAKEILRSASGLSTGESLEDKLKESPGVLSTIDTELKAKHPSLDSYADQILRALLVIRKELYNQKMMERDLAGILAEIIYPIRKVASLDEFRKTRIEQLSIILDTVLHMGGAHDQ